MPGIVYVSTKVQSRVLMGELAIDISILLLAPFSARFKPKLVEIGPYTLR